MVLSCSFIHILLRKNILSVYFDSDTFRILLLFLMIRLSSSDIIVFLFLKKQCHSIYYIFKYVYLTIDYTITVYLVLFSWRMTCNPLQYSCLDNPHGQRSLAHGPQDHKRVGCLACMQAVLVQVLKTDSRRRQNPNSWKFTFQRKNRDINMINT